jgi:hypothetical protein
VARLVAISLASLLPATAGVTIATTSLEPTLPATMTVTSSRTVTVTRTVTNQHAIRKVRRLRRQLQVAHRHLRQRWRPTVTYALRLASAVTGVSYRDLSAVSWCESRYEPFAENGRFKGIFQLGWAPFGFSPYDPIANALSAALTVREDGGWRQWQCQP